MSAELNSIINRMRSQADDLRVKLAEMDAGIAALTKIQGGADAAGPKRRVRKAGGNGIETHSNSAAAKDATLATYMSS